MFSRNGKLYARAFSLISISFLFLAVCADAQTTRLSIATGGTGGVYYVLGGGIAQVLSKNIPNTEVTAEVTPASVDNCKLIQAGKADLSLIMADTAYDAFKGLERFKAGGAVPVRTLAVAYSNYMHFVALDGSSGIKSMLDLKVKRVSTGAPGSGTEVMAMRVLESYGIDEKQIKRDRLGVSESAGALKDHKVDAFAWVGGLPTAAVLDIAATPGVKIRILANAEHLDKLNQKYGPVYFKATIPKTSYPNMTSGVAVACVANLLVCSEKMDAGLAYNILKVLFEHQPDLVVVHKEASNFTLASATVGSSIPFHPGAIKYYREKGIKIQ